MLTFPHSATTANLHHLGLKRICQEAFAQSGLAWKKNQYYKPIQEAKLIVAQEPNHDGDDEVHAGNASVEQNKVLVDLDNYNLMPSVRANVVCPITTKVVYPHKYSFKKTLLRHCDYNA